MTFECYDKKTENIVFDNQVSFRFECKQWISDTKTDVLRSLTFFNLLRICNT